MYYETKEPSRKEVFDAMTGGDYYDCPDWAPGVLDRASEETIIQVRSALKSGLPDKEVAWQLDIID